MDERIKRLSDALDAAQSGRGDLLTLARCALDLDPHGYCDQYAHAAGEGLAELVIADLARPTAARLRAELLHEAGFCVSCGDDTPAGKSCYCTRDD